MNELYQDFGAKNPVFTPDYSTFEPTQRDANVPNINTKEEAPPETPSDSDVVKAVTSAVKEVYGVDAKPMGIGGGTVAAYIRNTGIPAAVWIREDATEHGPDENVRVSNILGNAKVFTHVIQQSFDGKK